MTRTLDLTTGHIFSVFGYDAVTGQKRASFQTTNEDEANKIRDAWNRGTQWNALTRKMQ